MLLQISYQSVEASVIFFAVCLGRWHRDMWPQQTGQAGELGQVGGGMELDSVETVTKSRMKGKLKAIMDNLSHLLYAELGQFRSTFSHRIIQHRASNASKAHLSHLPSDFTSTQHPPSPVSNDRLSLTVHNCYCI